MKLLWTLFIFLPVVGFNLMIGSAPALAKTVVIQRATVNLLMADTDTVNHNNEALKRLRPGDRVVFRWYEREKFWSLKWQLKEKSYIIGEFLGEGFTTKVFALQNEPTRVLRIPKNWNVYLEGPKILPTFITDWIVGYKMLWPQFKAMPQMFENVPELFIEAERIGKPGDPTLTDLFENPEKFSVLQRMEMLEALEVFARKTADLIQVGDFKTGQIIYTRDRGWVLVDWSNGAYWRTDLEHHERNKVGVQNIFQSVYENEKFFTNEVYDPIQRKRVPVFYTEERKAWFGKLRTLLDESIHHERWRIWRGVEMPQKIFIHRLCIQSQAKAM